MTDKEKGIIPGKTNLNEEINSTGESVNTSPKVFTDTGSTSSLSSLLTEGNRDIVQVSREEEYLLMNYVKLKDDALSKRLQKYYAMPDLSRTEGHPVKLITDQIKSIEMFKKFDIVEIPEVVGLYETFDLFDFAADHPARSKSDTYYVTDDKILRTHTTVMRYYYLNDEKIKEKLAKNGEIGALCHGKVYRKDEIDHSHYPVFHQMDGLYICEKDKQIIGKQELVDVLVKMAQSIYGKDVEYQVLDDTFPYTDPSAQIEIKFGDKWLEILGSGVVKDHVLENLGIDSKKYNGWAFGPGIERLAMIKKQIPDIRVLRSEDPRITKQRGNLDKKYEEVSKYPPVNRDISFIINKDISLNALFEIVRDEAGDLVEEVTQLDKYENSLKFGEDKISYTYRITYRSHERTLLNDEINDIQSRIREKTESMLQAQLR